MPQGFHPTQVASSLPFDNADTIYVADNVQDAILETALNAGSSRYGVIFSSNGTASNKFLELFQSVASNDTPYVIAESGVIASLSASVKNDTTVTFSVRVNAVEVTTITINNGKLATVSGLSINIAQGDAISVFISSGSCRDPVVSVNIKVA